MQLQKALFDIYDVVGVEHTVIKKKYVHFFRRKVTVIGLAYVQRGLKGIHNRLRYLRFIICESFLIKSTLLYL